MALARQLAARGRRAHLLELPVELYARVDAYADQRMENEPYRGRSRNAALILIIEAGLDALAPAKRRGQGGTARLSREGDPIATDRSRLAPRRPLTSHVQ
jgi:hypothetical protein